MTVPATAAGVSQTGSQWTVWRDISVAHARFVIPVLKNVGTFTSGPCRVLYVLHDRYG
jgi:hypothetical protein